MKRIFLLLIALSFAVNAFSQFEPRFWVPSGYFMEDVVYADSTTILVTGSNYYATSNDGGTNWRGLSSSGMFVKAAFFPSTNFGIAVGNDGKYRINTQCAYYWGWGSNKYIGLAQDLFDAYFINDYKGIVCGAQGTLKLSIDQASSWQTIESGTSSDLKGVHMVNDSIYFACASGGLVLKIKNDSVIQSDVLSASIDFNKVFFTTDSIGFIVGSNGALYQTIDQGENWNSIDLAITDDLLNIDFSSPLHGAVCGINGKIFYTEDGGGTWSLSEQIIIEDIRSVAFENDLIGYALGSSFVLYTSDGGASWVRVNGLMRNINFPTDSVGYACAFSGVSFRTKDAGNNWEPMNLNTPQYLNDIYFLSADTGYAVGGYDVFRTLDGGDTWTALPNPSQSSLYSVYFTDYEHGVAIGYRNSILYTDDAGETWDYTYNWNSSSWYLDIQFTSDDIAYFCTSFGAIYKSINGGQDWSIQSTGANTQLAKIYFVNDSTGWACGSEGRIVRTIDGGANWETQDSGYDDKYLNGIHFLNQDTGFVVGEYGTYLVTYDGGANWINYSSGSTDYSSLTFSPNAKRAYSSGGTGVFTIASFTAPVITRPLCAGNDKIYYYCKRPYYDNDDTRSALLEICAASDDFSNAIVLQNFTIDSVALVNATLPEYLDIGVYKYRIRDINDPTYASFERTFKVEKPAEVTVTLVDSTLTASSVETLQYAWYFRTNPNDGGYFIGNGPTVQLPGPGEFWVQSYSDCCDPLTDWTLVGECDGILLLQDDFVSEEEYTLCEGDSILIAGNYYSEAGVYRDSLINAQGCDSILISTINLSIPDSTSLITSICSNESFQVGSSVYTEPGYYIDTLSNANGCDSIIFLDLTVYPAYTTQIDSSICLGDSVSIGASIYTDSGFYIDSLSTIYGCDSIIELNLNVEFQGDVDQTFYLCEGDSINVGDNFYSIEGNYIDSIFNSTGCLSVYYTSLFVFENPNPYLGSDTTICEDESLILDAGVGFESYFWNTNELSQTIEVSEANVYSVDVVDENGCMGSDSIELSVDICASIADLEAEYGIRIYPNPTSGVFTIESNRSMSVSIYRSDGALVYQNNSLRNAEQIELIESGTYLIQFLLENELLKSYSLIVNK